MTLKCLFKYLLPVVYYLIYPRNIFRPVREHHSSFKDFIIFTVLCIVIIISLPINSITSSKSSVGSNITYATPDITKADQELTTFFITTPARTEHANQPLDPIFGKTFSFMSCLNIILGFCAGWIAHHYIT